MRPVRLAMAAFLALACVPFEARAQAEGQTHVKVDIVQIWENFIASSVAADACGGVEKTTRDNFLANLTTVTLRATQALQARNPSVPPADVASRMENASGQIRDKVQAEIKQNGCASTKIQPLLQMYKMHADMKF